MKNKFIKIALSAVLVFSTFSISTNVNASDHVSLIDNNVEGREALVIQRVNLPSSLHS